MPSFIRKPTVIEAVQWKPGVEHPGVFTSDCGEPYVNTINGDRVPVRDGDWIMPEPNGVHFYPCKDGVFQATYEPFLTGRDEGVSHGSYIRAYPLWVDEYIIGDKREYRMTLNDEVVARINPTAKAGAQIFADFVQSALNPEKRKTHRDLVPICRKFIDDNKIGCAETVYQTDRVAENALELVEAIAECIGYAKAEA